MTTQHPITPLPELVQKWAEARLGKITAASECQLHIATQAARWGADQELEACCKLLELSDSNAREFLTAARRPKPRSLKAQALHDLAGLMSELDGAGNHLRTSNCADRIRRALEQLDD